MHADSSAARLGGLGRRAKASAGRRTVFPKCGAAFRGAFEGGRTEIERGRTRIEGGRTSIEEGRSATVYCFSLLLATVRKAYIMPISIIQAMVRKPNVTRLLYSTSISQEADQ